MNTIDNDIDIDVNDIDINRLRNSLFHEIPHYNYILPKYLSGAIHLGATEEDTKIEKIKSFVEYLDNKNKTLEQDIEYLKRELISHNNTLNEIPKKFENIKNDNKILRETFFNYIDNKENKISYQYLNVDVFLDINDNDKIFNVYSSVIDFLKFIDFDVFIELDAVKGSWWKRFISKSNDFLSSQEVTDRLKEAEYALEVQILKSQSEVDKNQSEALSNIMISLQGIPNAAIRIGSLLVVKSTNDDSEVSLIVQTLTINQLHILNKNPSFLQQPKSILDRLSLESSNDNDNFLN